jgi:hypothetical protein
MFHRAGFLLVNVDDLSVRHDGLGGAAAGLVEADTWDL